MDNIHKGEVEIIFMSSSAPKRITNVVAVYTKDGLLCIELDDELIEKYPLVNVFSICSYHQDHWGTTKNKQIKTNVAPVTFYREMLQVFIDSGNISDAFKHDVTKGNLKILFDNLEEHILNAKKLSL